MSFWGELLKPETTTQGWSFRLSRNIQPWRRGECLRGLIVAMMTHAGFTPCPSVVASIILAAFVAAETPVISVARPLALIPLIILTRVNATMMLCEGVSGIHAGLAVADASRVSGAGGESDKNQSK